MDNILKRNIGELLEKSGQATDKRHRELIERFLIELTKDKYYRELFKDIDPTDLYNYLSGIPIDKFNSMSNPFFLDKYKGKDTQESIKGLLSNYTIDVTLPNFLSNRGSIQKKVQNLQDIQNIQDLKAEYIRGIQATEDRKKREVAELDNNIKKKEISQFAQQSPPPPLPPPPLIPKLEDFNNNFDIPNHENLVEQYISLVKNKYNTDLNDKRTSIINNWDNDSLITAIRNLKGWDSLDFSKVEPPKVEPPKVEPPKVEPPKVEPPKVEPPKVEPPKVEPPKVEWYKEIWDNDKYRTMTGIGVGGLLGAGIGNYVGNSPLVGSLVGAGIGGLLGNYGKQIWK